MTNKEILTGVLACFLLGSCAKQHSVPRVDTAAAEQAAAKAQEAANHAADASKSAVAGTGSKADAAKK